MYESAVERRSEDGNQLRRRAATDAEAGAESRDDPKVTLEVLVTKVTPHVIPQP